MVPISDNRGRRHSPGQEPTTPGFTCPTCPGRLRRTNGSVRCESCGYVPRHGAD